MFQLEMKLILFILCFWLSRVVLLRYLEEANLQEIFVVLEFHVF